MRIKSAILAIGILATASGAMAAEPQLVFDNGAEGKKIYKISEISRVSFDSEGLTVEASESNFHPYASMGSLIFDYEGVHQPSSLEKVSIGTGKLRVAMSATHDSLTLRGIPEGSLVAIYTSSGVKAASVKASDGDIIDIGNLPAGIYIITAANQSAKFIK